jgi:hypothetical protein
MKNIPASTRHRVVPAGDVAGTTISEKVCSCSDRALTLGCAMCHHRAMQRPKIRMLLELWKRCADQLAATSQRTRCWFPFCGELLMESDLLLRMLEYGKSAGPCSLNINANGILLTPDLAGLVFDCGLTASFPGPTPSPRTYARIRVRGDPDAVRQHRAPATGARGAPGILAVYVTRADATARTSGAT